MCEALARLLQEELIPTATRALESAEGARRDDLARLLEGFSEMVEDIDAKIMDEWECGELYETFVRYGQSGDFLDRIS